MLLRKTIKKFSKIGTNPMKYIENYEIYINEIQKGETLNLKNLKIYHQDVPIFQCNSESTFRQNIDAWVWMGLVVRKNKNEIIKIKKFLDRKKIIDYIKYMLFVDDDDELVNIHRNTIIIKLIAINNKSKISPIENYTYEEIIKECGEFERIISSDDTYINLILDDWSKLHD